MPRRGGDSGFLTRVFVCWDLGAEITQRCSPAEQGCVAPLALVFVQNFIFFPLWAVCCRPQTAPPELRAVCGGSSRQSCSRGPIACNRESEGRARGCAFYKLVTGKLTFILLFLLDFNLLPLCVCTAGA